MRIGNRLCFRRKLELGTLEGPEQIGQFIERVRRIGSAARRPGA